MIKKLLQGFMFGVGFTLAIILVVWVINVSDLSLTTKPTISSSEGEINYAEQAKWRALPISEKMTKTTGLALLRFKEGEDKHMAAYVEIVLSKDDSIEIPLNTGDRVEKSDYYAKDGFSSNRNGVLLLYTGNPAREIEGTYLYDDRLIAYGDMPLELFLKKFNDEQTN